MNTISGPNLQHVGLGNLPDLGENTPADSKFKDMLLKSISDVNEMQQDADRAVEGDPLEDVGPLVLEDRADGEAQAGPGDLGRGRGGGRGEGGLGGSGGRHVPSFWVAVSLQ